MPHSKREELKNFVTFVDKIYLPFARENHASATHDHFRCVVMKEHFKDKRFDEITTMMIVTLINQRLKSETIRKEEVESGVFVNRKRSPTTVNKER